MKPIDPCTPRGYLHDNGTWKLSRNGNFSECRSASLKLLQRGKGIFIGHFIVMFFIIVCNSVIFCLRTTVEYSAVNLFTWNADSCSYQNCFIGSTFLPKLQGNFLATENFFYTLKVAHSFWFLDNFNNVYSYKFETSNLAPV